ncbi:MAG TPA: bifunctional riboflavin kinase/FAD synthetase [Candidatus Limnocylindrales bacterium]|nr:bifunctional riboflavin kinase/FAD synthetase [Candidatus Limnocylindrales bacterium]
MNIIHAANELKPAGRKVCLAIGFFDGVHLGHQQIIRQTIADAHQHGALALVLTFDRHPNAVVAPDHVPPLIYSLPQKLRAIGSLGADTLLLIHFDEKFSRQTGEKFVRSLARDVGQIQSLCVGADFVFGHHRSGNVTLLKKLGGEIGFAVHGLAAVSLDGQIVSSTRIRELIRAGDLDAAGQMLGRPYAISGRVITGNRLGQQLGFPTANLDTTGLMLPPNGVYAGIANYKKNTHRAAINIGFRPTVTSDTQLTHIEAHLLNFNGDLYGEELELEIGEMLRKEKKFSSTIELRQQIARDIAAVAAKT